MPIRGLFPQSLLDFEFGTINAFYCRKQGFRMVPHFFREPEISCQPTMEEKLHLLVQFKSTGSVQGYNILQ